MSFKTVYNYLFDQVSNYPVLTNYVVPSQFLKGFKDNIPNQEYTVIFEPGNEEEVKGSEVYKNLKEFVYNIDIYARTILIGVGGIQGTIVGYENKKGLLDFVDDIKAAIRSNLALGYNRRGSSVSAENTGTTFDLLPTKKYISVSINGETPVGCDSILCGTTTLTGVQVAFNIQNALRELGNHSGDGYFDVICSFNSTTRKFTIVSDSYCPRSSVIVTAGGSDDCSTLLCFDNPTEVTGRNIVNVEFGLVSVNNEAFPVRYRVISIKITEEVLI